MKNKFIIKNSGFAYTPKFGVSLQNKRGFTLIEIMVSVTVFTLVMVISMGSILSAFDANRKSQSLRAVMDNINFTLESMTRTIRFGTNYHCNVNVTSPSVSSPNNCAGGATSMAVLAPDGLSTYYYRLNNGSIQRSQDGSNYSSVTGSDVNISKLTFYVLGALPYTSNDYLQPKVIMVVKGNFTGSKVTTDTTFTIETMVSQRKFDSQ